MKIDIDPMLLRGVVIPHRNGNVFVRVELSRELFSDILIHAWPERSDRCEFTATVSWFYIAQEKSTNRTIREICKDAIERANWMPTVWCAEWCAMDSWKYGPW